LSQLYFSGGTIPAELLS